MTLRRSGSCETCGRPHLEEDGRQIRGCLCHWKTGKRWRSGPGHGQMQPEPETPQVPPIDQAEQETASAWWPFGGRRW